MEYTEDSKICPNCVCESYLSKEIRSEGKRNKCAFCEQVSRTYTLSQLTDRVEQVVFDHYERTQDQPSEWEYYRQHADKESTYVWYREGQTIEELMLNEFEIPSSAAAVMIKALEARHYNPNNWAVNEENDFGSDTHYEIKAISGGRWSSEWLAFEQALKFEARFFSTKVIAHLDTIFQGLEKFRTWHGKCVITTIGPGQEIGSLYRARVFQSRGRLLEALCEPNTLLGSPAAIHATSGRMNASGVAVFYGATEALTAISEVRPPVGSQVAVARFELLRPLQVLDLRELSNVREMVSVFDPEYLNKMEKAMFLRILARKMTQPFMPDDEAFEYLTTQAIADYLASQTKVPYDGIIYPSAQVAGDQINIVLFNKSARVMPIELPPGTRLQARDEEWEEDGPYESYEVTEWIPKRKKKTSVPADEEAPADPREPALRVNLNEVQVHNVNALTYTTTEHNVNRNRQTERHPIKRKVFDF